MDNRVWEFLKNRKVVKWLISRLRSWTFFDGITFHDVFLNFIRDFDQNEIFERASGVAFSFTMAIFPAIIFLITLIPYIQGFIPELSVENIMSFIGGIMPPRMFEQVRTILDDIINKPRGGLLSFGAVTALYLSTNGMMSLIKAFNNCYRTKESRGYFSTFALATLLTMMLSFSLFLAVLLLFVGQVFLEFFKSLPFFEESYVFYLLVALRFVVVTLVFLLVISTIYYLAPVVHNRWPFFSVGSVTATVLSILVSYGFSIYISNFGTYNKLYGSIGAMVAFMFWLYLISLILLSGFELNASIDKARRLKAISKRNT
jgi:membrane protein